MGASDSLAAAVLGGDRRIAERMARSLLKPSRTNFVERPWGGTAMREFKGLCPLPDQRMASGAGLGEAFEIAACDDDAETSRFPSSLVLEDGSSVTLPALLARHAETLLGREFVARYGKSFPLLPKILDIKELLSVQGHPAGNTEVYVVIDAEPGATIRLGFNRDIEPAAYRAELESGLRLQERLLAVLEPAVDEQRLQNALSPWFADREADASDALEGLEEWLAEGRRSEARALLEGLKRCYWSVLDSLNEIQLTPKQTIYNANPPRIAEAAGIEPSAEVHALGNPEGREILVLEIRRPGPTFRAWDNVRFPRRDVDLDAALNALNLRRTQAHEFIVERESVPERPGASRSVVSPHFSVEHLEPVPGRPVAIGPEAPHCLHVIKGSVAVVRDDWSVIDFLVRGDSAIVPVGVGAYQVDTDAADADIVKVALPAGLESRAWSP